MTDAMLPDDVFADTCILLNFVQREWERDVATDLIEHDGMALVNRWIASASTVRTSGMKRETADDPCRRSPASRAKRFS